LIVTTSSDATKSDVLASGHHHSG
jgi:hypothetical protein